MSKPIVYMDSCCFIDLAMNSTAHQTANEPHTFFCRKFIEAARSNDIDLFVSTLAVVECVSIKSASGEKVVDDSVKALFRGMLLSGRSGVKPVIPTITITERARDLLWDHGLTCKPMDSTHIATAIDRKCTHFLTSDNLGSQNIEKLKKLNLIVCTADKAKELLPDKYLQYELKEKPKNS